MTERLYYQDAHCTKFDAVVVERLTLNGYPALILDCTAFYPTGGGQPHDTGHLALSGAGATWPVVDVVEREGDGAVVHVLSPLESGAGLPQAGQAIKGEVDWRRRFDLMQQHSGQHLLSAAFWSELAANTIGFHLSDQYSTIDLDRAPLGMEDLARAEALANAVVFENRQVTVRFVPDEEVASLSLRKPVTHQGPVRVVEIPGFDSSACGGTHVRATGEVGLIKVTNSERRGTETRVEFRCGGRALTDYHAKNMLVMELAQEFTVGYWELREMVHRLADQLKETRRTLRQTQDALLDAEASALWNQAELLAQVRVVHACLSGRTPEDLKHLVQRLAIRPPTVALLGSDDTAGKPGHVVFGRSDDLDLHMGTLVRRACEMIGGQGGGRPNLAQGGGPLADRVCAALEWAYQTVVDSLSQLPLAQDQKGREA